jgi:uncharacterized protein YecE (DUF72 family)
LPPERRFTIEFRHESWFDDDVLDALRTRDVAMCIAEQDDFKCPVQSTASWGYLRLHRLDYDETMLTEWAHCLAQQPWNEAFVYFKHDEGVGSGPPAVDAFVRAFAGASSGLSDGTEASTDEADNADERADRQRSVTLGAAASRD